MIQIGLHSNGILNFLKPSEICNISLGLRRICITSYGQNVQFELGFMIKVRGSASLSRLSV